MEILYIVAFLVLIVGGSVFLWRQTKTRGRWGLTFGRHNCPRCGTPLPLFRRPKTSDEALWGGWTCTNCGCKVDKYGRERVAG